MVLLSVARLGSAIWLWSGPAVVGTPGFVLALFPNSTRITKTRSFLSSPSSTYWPLATSCTLPLCLPASFCLRASCRSLNCLAACGDLKLSPPRLLKLLSSKPSLESCASSMPSASGISITVSSAGPSCAPTGMDIDPVMRATASSHEMNLKGENRVASNLKYRYLRVYERKKCLKGDYCRYGFTS